MEASFVILLERAWLPITKYVIEHKQDAVFMTKIGLGFKDVLLSI